MDPESSGFEIPPLEILINSHKAELQFSTVQELIGSDFADLEQLEPQEYQDFLDKMGISIDNIVMRRFSGEQDKLIFISSKLTPDIDVIHSFKESEITQVKDTVSVEDIYFENKSDNRTINVRSILTAYCDIQYVLTDTGKGGTGTFRRVRLVPSLCADKLPSGYQKQEEWVDFDRPFQVLTLFHEIAHARQHENVYKAMNPLPFLARRRAQDQAFDQVGMETKYIRLQERDAARFSFQTIRQFRDAGFDLLPGLTNDQLVNTAEENLLSYDWRHVKSTDKRFSNRVEHLPKGGGVIIAVSNRIKISKEMRKAHKSAQQQTKDGSLIS